MPIFFKITAQSGKESHLFGTLHLNDKKLTLISKEVKIALENAINCVFENDSLLDQGVQSKITRIRLQLFRKWFTAPDIFKSYLDEAIEDQKKLSGFLEKVEAWEQIKSTVEKTLQQVTPINFALGLLEDYSETVKNAQNLTNTPFLDQLLIKEAKKNNIPTHSLETLEENITAQKGFNLSIEEHIEFYHFVKSLLEKGIQKFSTETMKALYLQEDEVGLLNYCHSYKVGNYPEVVKKYYAHTITNRDANMARKLKPFLEQGNVFIAPGVNHIPGIINILLDEGYTITPIALSEKCIPAYEPKMSLGLFGFHPSAENAIRSVDPLVEIEHTTDGMVAKFKHFNTFPSLNTILSFPTEIKSPVENIDTHLDLIKSNHLDIGFFSTPQIRFSGDGRKINEYMETHGQGFQTN